MIQSHRSALYGYSIADAEMCSLSALQKAADRDMDDSFDLFAQAAAKRADLIVTTETINQVIRFDDMRFDLAALAEPLDGPLIERFGSFARRHSLYIVAGLLTRRGGQVFNSATLFDRSGHMVGLFDKVHIPVGETRVTAGSSYPVFDTDFGRLGMLVCWDMQFPEAARALVLAGAELIACPTWGWSKLYGCARALENSVTIAVSMGVMEGCPVWEDCDPSCILSNTGNVLAEAPSAGTHVVSADVDIHSMPPLPHYYIGHTALADMRQVRLSQRRPETYGSLGSPVVDGFCQKPDASHP